MREDEQKFEIKLPARITGLVFWGLVFVGLLFAVIFLQQAESDIIKKNTKNTRIIAYEVEGLVEIFPEAPVLEKTGARIRAKIIKYIDDFNFHAVRMYEDDRVLAIGEVFDSDDTYEYTLNYIPAGSNELKSIRIVFYCKDVKSVVADIRKKFLLSIGLGVFVFGLFLQRVLQKMLSAPFQKMVTTAEKFSQGDENVRFDDQRQDEFGYLGKFINNAIESILKHKDELILALERASASEIELNIEKERAEVTLYSITDTVVTVDIDKKVVYINPAGESLLHCTKEEITGKAFKDVFNLIDENSGDVLSDPLQLSFDSGETTHLPEHSSLIIRDDVMVSIEASIAPMKTETDDLMGAVIVVQDVSHTRRLTKQLSYQASHDLLTGLYNRRKFEEHLEEILINVKEEDRQHSLFYLDLDNFKIVNDTCGHVAGDELLKQLPVLFNEVLRSGDIVARLGGDEFGIILQNCELKQAATIADKIRQKIKNFRFPWKDRTFEIGVSIGVVAINAENSEKSQVLRSADIACYAAKDAGRNTVHIFELSDQAKSERFGQMHWTARILKAFEENRFQLYQQSIVGVADDNRDHMEILLRMIDKEGNIIGPDSFIPAAERYALMPKIDRWVIKEVFKHISNNESYDQVNTSSQVFAINLSGDSIKDPALFEYIIEQKDKYGVSLKNICFEITENIAIGNLTKATLFINKLKDHGCMFALDDFGSGLSSFAYLKNLPVDFLKIDGGFVKDISRDEIDRAMVESIQQVGKVMNLSTIAEHVEDESTLNVLREIGIDYVQGYYLGRPEVMN